jgi:hypothetical protein
VSDLALLVGDLHNARTVTGLSAKQWASQVNSHTATVVASINIVRVDLGLEPQDNTEEPDCSAVLAAS